jgi:hypothetical protein
VATKIPATLKAAKKRIRGRKSKRNFTKAAARGK